ncbi:DUF4145 domain-containing protein [Porticoccus sp. W117]|uniref:DUF4145 domain-containing protein n=1 Tax=Porticoccus sp. W117 TaxID=3054777 RepID=UPI0025973A35|nr:DUF4145 domain-containing protein [Porticoccus sp. W117]MDM3870378.1 DUF4145 domain-containing protein [Porticoccus sp. W117]
MKIETPTTSKTAFNCPHCSALTTQNWFKVFAGRFDEKQRTPTFPTEETLRKVSATHEIPEDVKTELLNNYRKLMSGYPFLKKSEESPYNPPKVSNCFITSCYNCKELTIWIHDKIVYPNSKLMILPNDDMPPVVRELFEEAREIVEKSPKGAAALLRLSIQHVCKELGESGKNIDKDIASLVSKGLNPTVQQALDIVRVVGNESVHPGEIDLNDNKDIAIQLFNLVNLICEQMISHPNKVKELYAGLPKNKLDGIDARDKANK